MLKFQCVGCNEQEMIDLSSDHVNKDFGSIRMTRRVSEKIAYGLLLLLVGLVGPQSATGDDLAAAIKKTESTSRQLIDGQKKDRWKDELKSVLNYDQLSAVLNKGKSARKAEIVAIRDHYISALPELTKKHRRCLL